MAVTRRALETEQLVIVCYPLLAGGKFIINSLGLSPDAVFSNADMALRQLQGKISTEDKLDYLHQKLDQADRSSEWTDLDMNCPDLFGVWTNDWYSNYLDYTLSRANNVVDMLATSHYKFFYIAHNTIILDQLLSVWPNARVIIFTDCAEICKKRLAPDSPFAAHFDLWHEQYKANLPQALFNRKPNQAFSLNAQVAFENWNNMYDTIDSLYRWLDLTPVDFNDLESYYTKWLHVTQKIKIQLL